MPTLAEVKRSNEGFSPNYSPVAVFVGATSGVGEAMAAGFARQLGGRAHIILIGRNANAASDILASFPMPEDTTEWKHEFVQCDVSSMAAVRAVCVALRARLERINYLVITAAGPAVNSVTESKETPEGLNAHLATRYFMRYLFTKKLVPLLDQARDLNQHAHMMTVLGAGFGITIPTTDLGLHDAQRRRYKMLQGVVPILTAMKGNIRGVAYNDGLVAHFASNNPNLAFTHILPGQVKTAGGMTVSLGWLLTPLAWLFNFIRSRISISQDDCAQYMLYALLDVERGVFIRDNHGDIVSAHLFNPDLRTSLKIDSPTAQKYGFLDGVPLKGYGGSDSSVAALVEYTERVLSEI